MGMHMNAHMDALAYKHIVLLTCKHIHSLSVCLSMCVCVSLSLSLARSLSPPLPTLYVTVKTLFLWFTLHLLQLVHNCSAFPPISLSWSSPRVWTFPTMPRASSPWGSQCTRPSCVTPPANPPLFSSHHASRHASLPSTSWRTQQQSSRPPWMKKYRVVSCTSQRRIEEDLWCLVNCSFQFCRCLAACFSLVCLSLCFSLVCLSTNSVLSLSGCLFQSSLSLSLSVSLPFSLSLSVSVLSVSPPDSVLSLSGCLFQSSLSLSLSVSLPFSLSLSVSVLSVSPPDSVLSLSGCLFQSSLSLSLCLPPFLSLS